MATAGDVLLALAAVCVVTLAMRWAFKPARRRTGPLVDAADSAELGLLDVVAAGMNRGPAVAACARLRAAGIRASLSRRHDGRMDLLVFQEDADRARILLQ